MFLPLGGKCGVQRVASFLQDSRRVHTSHSSSCLTFRLTINFIHKNETTFNVFGWDLFFNQVSLLKRVTKRWNSSRNGSYTPNWVYYCSLLRNERASCSFRQFHLKTTDISYYICHFPPVRAFKLTENTIQFLASYEFLKKIIKIFSHAITIQS